MTRLVNLAVSPGVKFKASSMPFVQMENISHFLRACEMPPLNLPSHDRFLTVDLYDHKDPAQVLQCIAAFSRRANAVNPRNFPEPLGGKSKGSSMSPQGTGSSTGARSPAYTTNAPIRPRGLSSPNDSAPSYTFNPLNKAAYSTSGRTSPTKPAKPSLARGGLASGGPVSSWSKEDDQSKTAPAWNIHQYGYMGGASQGNLGVAFGARRQITSQAPAVPSLAEKEKRLREKLEEEQRELAAKQAQEEADREYEAERRRVEEERARMEEERRWAAETKRLRQEEEDAKQVEEEQRLRKERAAAEAEQDRLAREREADKERQREADMARERNRQRTTSDARLNGQFLSQYQAGRTQPATASAPVDSQTAEAKRIADLERQLADLREQQRSAAASPPSRTEAPQLPSRPAATSHEDDWASSEREYLRKEWTTAQADPENYTPPKPARQSQSDSIPTRPLPDPTAYTPSTNRTDRYLASNPAPTPPQPSSHRPQDYSTNTEVDLENTRRRDAQQKTKAGGWASSSLLQREMERERERQREWEEGQKATAVAQRDTKEGAQPGQSWDVHQYGYMGGDSQNRGGPGLGVGGARRQIIGPRPPP
jgi:transgelin